MNFPFDFLHFLHTNAQVISQDFQLSGFNTAKCDGNTYS